jgi:hypothetical protein
LRLLLLLFVWLWWLWWCWWLLGGDRLFSWCCRWWWTWLSLYSWWSVLNNTKSVSKAVYNSIVSENFGKQKLVEIELV